MPSVEDEPSQLIYNLATVIVHSKQRSRQIKPVIQLGEAHMARISIVHTTEYTYATRWACYAIG